MGPTQTFTVHHRRRSLSKLYTPNINVDTLTVCAATPSAIYKYLPNVFSKLETAIECASERDRRAGARHSSGFGAKHLVMCFSLMWSPTSSSFYTNEDHEHYSEIWRECDASSMGFDSRPYPRPKFWHQRAKVVTGKLAVHLDTYRSVSVAIFGAKMTHEDR